MKKFYLKFLACLLITLCIISATSIPVSAATTSLAQPYSYYTENFSFKGSCTISKQCSGIFMDVSVKATASNNNNETITLEVYIVNTGKTKKYTFLSDGKTHEYKGIYLGLSGGSNVMFSFTGANPAITIYTEMIVNS